MPPPRAGKFLHLEPEKALNMPYHIIFIILFSERAPLEMAYISMSPKVYAREQSDRVGGGGGLGGDVLLPAYPVQRNICIWNPEKKQFLMHILGKDY